MHNLPGGHEKQMRPVGMNNTDPGRWQQFCMQCHAISNMTFDEGRWQWHDMNRAAADKIVEAMKLVTPVSMTSSTPSASQHSPRLSLRSAELQQSDCQQGSPQQSGAAVQVS